MRRSSADTCETHASIQRYVSAAIIEARRVYFDQNWIAWAEHWIAGRDRSFASARAAHRIARQACDRESVAMASREHESLQNDDTSDDPLETPAAMAVWAAGLALITASIAPDPMAKIWRMKWRMNLVLGSRITQVCTVGGVSAQRPSLDRPRSGVSSPRCRDAVDLRGSFSRALIVAQFGATRIRRTQTSSIGAATDSEFLV
jgi:hypothetical protein